MHADEKVIIEINNQRMNSLKLFVYIGIGLMLINTIFDIQTVPHFWGYIFMIRILIVLMIYGAYLLFKYNKVNHFISLLMILLPIYIFVIVTPEIIVFKVEDLNVINVTLAFVILLLPLFINIVTFKEAIIYNSICMSILLVTKLLSNTYSLEEWYLYGGGFVIMFAIFSPFIAKRKYKSLIDIYYKQIEIQELHDELLTLNKKLTDLSNMDQLTETFNRRGLFNLFNYELAKLKRVEKPLSVLLLDIDDFKKVNDQYGHMEGDIVLKDFAFTIKQNLREGDLLCRWGGEEFVVVLVDADYSKSMIISERIQKTINEKRFGKNKLKVTATIGITSTNKFVETDYLINQADSAMLQGKKIGKNTIILFQNIDEMK